MWLHVTFSVDFRKCTWTWIHFSVEKNHVFEPWINFIKEVSCGIGIKCKSVFGNVIVIWAGIAPKTIVRRIRIWFWAGGFVDVQLFDPLWYAPKSIYDCKFIKCRSNYLFEKYYRKNSSTTESPGWFLFSFLAASRASMYIFLWKNVFLNIYFS